MATRSRPAARRSHRSPVASRAGRVIPGPSRTPLPHRRPRWRSAAGATLVEVLVALVVLSVGLLGLARLQTTALRINHAAYLRTQAVLHASDLAERLRAGAAPAARGTTAHLPEGERAVRCTGAGACTVSVEWRARRGPGTETTSLALEVRL